MDNIVRKSIHLKARRGLCTSMQAVMRELGFTDRSDGVCAVNLLEFAVALFSVILHIDDQYVSHSDDGIHESAIMDYALLFMDRPPFPLPSRLTMEQWVRIALRLNKHQPVSREENEWMFGLSRCSAAASQAASQQPPTDKPELTDYNHPLDHPRWHGRRPASLPRWKWVDEAGNVHDDDSEESRAFARAGMLKFGLDPSDYGL